MSARVHFDQQLVGNCPSLLSVAMINTMVMKGQERIFVLLCLVFFWVKIPVKVVKGSFGTERKIYFLNLPINGSYSMFNFQYRPQPRPLCVIFDEIKLTTRY